MVVLVDSIEVLYWERILNRLDWGESNWNSSTIQRIPPPVYNCTVARQVAAVAAAAAVAEPTRTPRTWKNDWKMTE